MKFLVDLRADLLAALPRAPALDPVAHFHLTNGALVSRIYWLADTSAHGMEQSYGMMVSYRYEPSEVEENHERYRRDGRIATARLVSRLFD